MQTETSSKRKMMEVRVHLDFRPSAKFNFKTFYYQLSLWSSTNTFVHTTDFDTYLMTILSISENSEAKNSYWAQFVENSFLKEKKNLFHLSSYVRPQWCPFEDKGKLGFSSKINSEKLLLIWLSSRSSVNFRMNFLFLKFAIGRIGYFLAKHWLFCNKFDTFLQF